jgi:hypothetical protein
MAIGWMTALKMVPWGDVIENAPKVVSGAKKLFTRTFDEAASAAPTASTTGASVEAKAPIDVDQRIAQLIESLAQSQSRIGVLEAESRDTAALIKSLAEQQEKVIGAIDVLGKRSNVLIGTVIVLALACVGMVVALVMR